MQVDNSRNKEYRINIQEILDYNFCPVYYKLKHDNPGENISDAYDRILRACFYSYINLLKNNSSVDIGYLTRLWGKHWVKDASMTKMMLTPSSTLRDKHGILRKNGIDSLISFHNLMKEGEQYPILTNKQYSIKINNNITLNGTFEYIREYHEDNKDPVFQIIKFNHKKDKFQTLMQMRHDLELTATALAFKTMFTADNFQVAYANIYKEKIITSFRDENDFNTLRQTVINTVKCIKNNIYTVSPDVKCFHCTYRNECEAYIKKGGQSNDVNENSVR